MLHVNHKRCTSPMLGSPAGPGAPSQRGLWTSASIPSAAGFAADGFGKYGVYSLFPGGPTFGSALYSHANAFGRFTSGQFQSTAAGGIFHGNHKVSDSLFSSSGYTFGAPTPPPGSPYSPIPVTQLELLTKGINSNIIIQQSSEFSLSPKKVQIAKSCDEKCCNNPKQKLCPCRDDSPPLANLKGRYPSDVVGLRSGCSRTNPIEWGGVNVKKEPCQVAEITTSGASPAIKVEVTSPRQRNNGAAEKDLCPMANGNIPVGIAVARQRIQQPELINSPSLPPAGLLTTVTAAGQFKEIARLSEIESTQTGMAASVTGGGASGHILQCPEDRGTALANWPLGGSQSAALAAPTLWQCPAPVPMESMVPLPMPPVGFQLVRDPTSGGLLLLPTTTTNLEPIQQAVVWPTYPQPSPLLLPPLPPPPLQLISSATPDYLTSATTFHQHTQTHSTRLLAVTTDTKRKLPLQSTTLIKIETDPTALDQAKTLSTMSGAVTSANSVYSDQSIAPLMTTHLIYQHPPNLILSQPATVDTATCKPRIESPVPCLTPPPEHTDEPLPPPPPLAVDASNQTDTPICSEDDNTLQTLPEETATEPESTAIATIETKEEKVEPSNPPQTEIPKPEENEEKELPKPDLSGLELLSNSIVEFESCRENTIKTEDQTTATIKPENETKNRTDDVMGGLDLLCALAEQRILEESTENVPPIKETSKSKKRKSRRHSDEPKYKKRKSDKYSDDDPRFKLKVETKKRSASEGNNGDINDGDIKCKCCREQIYNKFLKPEPETNEDEWPAASAVELDVRMRLAELHRQYKEKRRELSKLSSKKRHHHHHRHRRHHADGCLKKRKKSHSDDNLAPQPAPTDVVAPLIVEIQPALEPATLRRKSSDSRHKEKKSSVPSSSSSKKRKVGRPKRIAEHSAPTTETIVAKKPKTGLVGYLLAAKEKLQMRPSFSDSPPRFIDETASFNNNNNNEEDFTTPYDVKKQVSCTLTSSHLEMENLRVLTAMGGLFYAGQLHAVQPPDVYSITLDGERGNRPHIMSREEILRDAIVEIAPGSTKELETGTRLCAYWSQQYRCLYPGSVAEPGTPDPEFDAKFVTVEFDDGDNGTIALEDIRLLPPNYPVMEYDPNPLLSLSKRKRRTSSSATTAVLTAESRQSPTVATLAASEESQSRIVVKEECEPATEMHKERKRLKKKKKEKLHKLLQKKKKRKHKCVDETCKHKKHHKKHRKHKKHHHDRKENSNSSRESEESPSTSPLEDEEETLLVDEGTESPTSPEEATDKDEDFTPNPEDEVTMDDILEVIPKTKKIRDRQASCESSRSKMSAFLPARQLWSWSGKGYKRPKGKGRGRKEFHKSIQRGKESISVGDSAVFLSTGRPDRPYIGRIEAMWENYSTMVVKVKWFYHPEETVGCPENLQYPGALFESPHADENDVQTISHKCEVLPLAQYIEALGNDPRRFATIYENNDIYYLAGHYDPTSHCLKMKDDIPCGDKAGMNTEQ